VKGTIVLTSWLCWVSENNLDFKWYDNLSAIIKLDFFSK